MNSDVATWDLPSLQSAYQKYCEYCEQLNELIAKINRCKEDLENNWQTPNSQNIISELSTFIYNVNKKNNRLKEMLEKHIRVLSSLEE